MVAVHNLTTRGCRDDDLDFVHDLSILNMKEYVDRFWGGWKEELFWADIDKDNITIIEREGKRIGFFDMAVENDMMRIRNIQVAKDSQGAGNRKIYDDVDIGRGGEYAHREDIVESVCR